MNATGRAHARCAEKLGESTHRETDLWSGAEKYMSQLQATFRRSQAKCFIGN